MAGTEAQGGIASTSLVPGIGEGEWARRSGAAGLGAGALFGEHDLFDEHVARIATQPDGGMRSNSEGPGAALLDDWRDVFNWRNSPAPWILLLLLVMLGMMQFRVMTRVGKARADVALG